MEYLDALRLQLEWGADEALLDDPQNRFAAQPKPAATPSLPGPVAATPRPRAIIPGLPPGPAEAEQMAAACATLEDLRAALQNFSGCGLRDTATQLVFADGADDTNLILIGEAPGAEKTAPAAPSSAPPASSSTACSPASASTAQNAASSTPSRGARPATAPPARASSPSACRSLRRHIALIRPAGLLLLGAVAAKAMLPAQTENTGIRRLRGRWHSLDIPGLDAPIAALPTYHPAYLLRTPNAKRESWHDLIALRQWLNDGTKTI